MKKILIGAVVFFLVIVVLISFKLLKNDQQISKNPLAILPTILPMQTSAPTKSCPEGFILVPGSKLYNTGDFCVMKYEAKCADSSNVEVGLAPGKGAICSGASVSGGWGGVYKNNGKGCACNAQNNRQVVSTKSGFPITYIAMSDKSTDNAKAYCADINGHLVTNNEWMTIARNVEQVRANWCSRNGTGCGAEPGTRGKILANGHNDDANEATASAGGSGALIAADDSKACFGTTTDGSNNCGGKSSQKRTLTLSNRNIIWDLAGNVWEWVDAEVMRKDEPESQTVGVTDRGWLRSDFAPGSDPSVITDNGQGVLGYDAMRPSNPKWNANNGVGRIYHYSDPGDTSTALYAFIRGGNWRHLEDDGAFTIHLSPPASTENIDDVGFRCATAL